jgi:ribosomal protein S18 acetylase RimI-like enzyme
MTSKISNLKIKQAKIQDALWIAQAQVNMARETEDFELNLDTVSRGVEHIFANPSIGGYYAAYMDDKIIACLLTLLEWSDWRAKNVAWVHSLYVEPEYRNQGIFKSMHEYLVQEFQQAGFAGIRLYVDKTNTLAQKAYEKVGYNGQHYRLFEFMF